MTATPSAQAVRATPPPRRPIVLAIGDERFARRLGEHLPDMRTRSIQAPDETDGYGVDLIIVVGAYPLSTLTDVLVHPSLSRLPVVLVAPGRDIDRRGWESGHVHVVLDREDPLTSAPEYIRERLRPEDRDRLLVQSVPIARRGARGVPPVHTGRHPTRRGRRARRTIRPRTGPMKVEDICNPLLVSARLEETLRDAGHRMTDNDVGSAAVFGTGGLLGILTERDLARSIADGVDPERARVEDYMTGEPITVTPETRASDAAQIMLEIGVRHLPVVRDEHLIGMVSIRDILLDVLGGAKAG